MVEISSLVVSSLTGVFGVVIGAVISNYFNQKIARQSSRKDIIFKKKIEYFENILNCIEKNIELYKNSIKMTEKDLNKKELEKIIANLKSGRKKFDVMTSPLYIDTSHISREILRFVSREKTIFVYFEKLRDNLIEKEDAARGLNLDLIELKKIGAAIVKILRKKLRED